MERIDRVMPDGKWSFDSEVTDVFDDMLKRSIPQYEAMRDAVLELGSSFVRQGTTIVDLGCSRGEALAPFVRRFGAANRHVGLEVSEPMLEAARARFAPEVELKLVEILRHDLREPLPSSIGNASLVLSVLTLQFTPIEHRLRILRDAFRALRPGGALVLVEKVLGQTADLDALFVERFLAGKRERGYSKEEVERKKLSLEGVLVPVTAAMNEQLLESTGFREVDCFWRWCNFAGWLAVKER